jgi:hypothetical protein
MKCPTCQSDPCVGAFYASKMTGLVYCLQRKIKLLEIAVANEREACAKEADVISAACDMMQDIQYRNGALMVAVAIRNRSKR